jgi:hypothetical protein
LGDGKVWINGERWFENVPEAVWNFRIGGYQPAQKWLKDRAGKGGANARDGRIPRPTSCTIGASSLP